MKRLVVSKKYDNKNIKNFLMDSFDGLSLNVFYKSLRKKDILVNGKRISKEINIKENDIVKVYILDDFLYKSFSLDIVYEDQNILVINKPIGIEVISNNLNKNTVTSLLSKSYNYIYPCHRLDMNTSGLVLFAKNSKSLEILVDKFKNKEIEKYYKCTVFGIPKKSKDTLTAFLFKDSKKSLVYISDTFKKGYQKIITSYTLISSNKKENTSILEVCLHTGRTHQIRAHLAHIGLPIIRRSENMD